MVLVIVGGLLAAPQLNTSAPIGSTDPSEAQGGGPPVTDSDRDKIPNVFEDRFGVDVEVTSSDGRSVQVRGLDPLNASDNETDFDRDGLTAIEEYCWPYALDRCFTSRSGQTGILDLDTQRRVYLDPTSGDSDGDGLPDGYEVMMCAEVDGSKQVEGAWDCAKFDPLNASDGKADYDLDGFDVDRDGILETDEYFSNAEEYLFGAPDNWTTEIDGLRYGPNVFGEDDWYGTDPLKGDSDSYAWAPNYQRPSRLTLTGDSIPDGWEVYFGLDPLNASDNILDADSDGWDEDGDGVVKQQLTQARIHLDEAFSNLEEYQVFLDDGTWVEGGLKFAEVSLKDDADVTVLDQGDLVSPIAHYDVRSLALDEDLGMVYVGARTGVSVLKYNETGAHETQTVPMPTGVRVNEIRLHRPENATMGVLIVATSTDVRTLPIGNDGWITDHIPLAVLDIGNTTLLRTWNTDPDSFDHILAFGPNVTMHRIAVGGDGSIPFSKVIPIDQGPLITSLQSGGVVVQDALHITGSSSRPDEIYFGTDLGMLRISALNLTTDVPVWLYGSNGVTIDVSNISIGIDTLSNREAVDTRALVADGPDGGEATKIWIAAKSGLHSLNLFTGDIDPEILLSGDDVLRGNDLWSVKPLPRDDKILLGSTFGMWAASYAQPNIGAETVQTRIPGRVVDMVVLETSDDSVVFAACDPGQFANIVLMDPKNNDSDFDGLPDGWEYIYGLDPSDPYDGREDSDGDGLDLDLDGFVDRPWTNRDEFEYRPLTINGTNTTDPRNPDSDADELPDGVEFYGEFGQLTDFSCHYLEDGTYVCDADLAASWPVGTPLPGEVARQNYALISDHPTDPKATDSDGDGMPDGWEIMNRRWIGQTFSGANSWTLDPNDPSDAWLDADGDGLANLCEYNWTRDRDLTIAGTLKMFNEDSESALNWSLSDPNLIDSDGDGLPDGWEARMVPGQNKCDWKLPNRGINPLNGSDAFNNPDNDGVDLNLDGILSEDEALTNFLEYHLRDTLFSSNGSLNGPTTSQTASGAAIPAQFFTNLTHDSWSESVLTTAFGASVDPARRTAEVSIAEGALNPTMADTDNDEMPDGWEVYHARWDGFQDQWTLNPVNDTDQTGDPDKDGMPNWAEFNSIDSCGLADVSDTLVDCQRGYQLSDQKVIAARGSPMYHLAFDDSQSAIGKTDNLTKLASNPSDQFPFGHWIDSDVLNKTGPTCDPNSADTDGDGILDGLEMIFTSWSDADKLWTLNPLSNASLPGAVDGTFDPDGDGLTDKLEFSVASQLPNNGASFPLGATLFPAAIINDESAFSSHQNNTITLLNDTIGNPSAGIYSVYTKWDEGGRLGTPLVLQTLFTILHPTSADTDEDGMSDGFEYWFAEFDSVNRTDWTTNPLNGSDADLDADGDSVDCNGDGVVSSDESFTNLREYQGRIFGVKGRVPPGVSGLLPWQTDAKSAVMDELMIDLENATALLVSKFVEKDPSGTSKLRYDLMVASNPTIYETALLGVGDPTHPDSDADGMDDGWEFCNSYYTIVERDSSTLHYATSPVNPIDGRYDGDHDGWTREDPLESLAPLVTWDGWNATASSEVPPTIVQGVYFPYNNTMEYLRKTDPRDNDSDDDSQLYNFTFDGSGDISGLEIDLNLTDGREVLRYGMNPLSDDTDGDFLPDWYEFSKGWNETNKNWSSLRSVAINWDTSDPIAIEEFSDFNGDLIGAPILQEVWTTFNPTDPSDATEDWDQDGKYKIEGGVPTYYPYNNFQEFFMINNFTSADDVRANLNSNANTWFEFRAELAGATWFSATDHYLAMTKVNSVQNPDDPFYASIIIDDDRTTQTTTPVFTESDILLNGSWTSAYNRNPSDGKVTTPLTVPMWNATSRQNVAYLSQSTEYVYGWWLLDIDGDHIADGSDPFSWDTDGDWSRDSHEVSEDIKYSALGNDRGSGLYSPIRWNDFNAQT